MTLSLIVAVADNGVIGHQNRLPWKLLADLKHFKDTTSDHHIIMGRKTFESIGRPLPNRTNIVISRNKKLKIKNVIIKNSLNDALKFSKKEKEAFIIGGEDIYKLALPKTDKIYLTKVHTKPKGDSHFPKLNNKKWKKINCIKHKKDDKNEHDYDFCIYEKK